MYQRSPSCRRTCCSRVSSVSSTSRPCVTRLSSENVATMSVMGRPITDIVATFSDDNLVTHGREVLETLETREQQVRRHEGDLWYIRRIRPYRSLENTIDGVVVTFLEITELK